MKTIERWMDMLPLANPYDMRADAVQVGEETLREIQLDAFRAGMLYACKLIEDRPIKSLDASDTVRECVHDVFDAHQSMQTLPEL